MAGRLRLFRLAQHSSSSEQVRAGGVGREGEGGRLGPPSCLFQPPFLCHSKDALALISSPIIHLIARQSSLLLPSLPALRGTHGGGAVANRGARRPNATSTSGAATPCEPPSPASDPRAALSRV